MAKLLELPSNVLLGDRQFGISDDHLYYTDTNDWTKLVADAGSSVAAGDTAAGVVTLTTGGTDNNEAMIKSTQKVFKVANDKTLFYRSRLTFAEGNTNAANLYEGFSSAAAANLMVDNGAGPAANHSAVGFYKVDGQTVWGVHCSVGTTQQSVLLTAANSLTKSAVTAGSSSQQVLEINVRAINSTDCEAAFMVNGVTVYKLVFTYTSAAVMNAVHYIKAGSSTSESVAVDRTDVYQLR